MMVAFTSPPMAGTLFNRSTRRAMASSDGGKTWTDISTGLPNRFITSITVDPNNSATAYLTVSGFKSGHVFRTNNTGNAWADISGNLPDIPTNALLVDPLNSNILYAGTDIGVFRSTLGGNTWGLYNQGLLPVIVNAFSAQPGGLIQAATYGRGIYQLVRNSGGGGLDARIPAGGGLSKISLGQAASPSVSYGRVTASTGSLPVPLAIFALTQGGILVTEAGVSATSSVTSARLFVDYASGIDSGVAIVNPGDTALTIAVVLRDASGNTISSSTLTVGPKSHAAKFVSQLGLNLPNPFLGTLTLSSTSPFAAVNLRIAANGHGEPILTTLPLIDLNAPPKGTILVFAQVVDGGGVPTQILLLNPSPTTQSVGTVSLFDDNGLPLTLNFGADVGAREHAELFTPSQRDG